MKKLLGIAAIIIILTPTLALAKHQHKERWYQERWCAKHFGITEYVLPDKTRVDCLTRAHAIEFDYGYKWAESLGQAMHYGRMTQRKPGVVLILEKPNDHLKVFILEQAAKYWGVPLTVWTIMPKGKTGWIEGGGPIE